MTMSRLSLYYPRRLSEPAAGWAHGRLWRLLIPVFMGVGQRLAGPFGPSLALAVMIVAHVATSPEWQHLAADRWSGLLQAPWLSAAQLVVRERFGLTALPGKTGGPQQIER